MILFGHGVFCVGEYGLWWIFSREIFPSRILFFSVAKAPKTAFHSTTHLYSDQANPLMSIYWRDKPALYCFGAKNPNHWDMVNWQKNIRNLNILMKYFFIYFQENNNMVSIIQKLYKSIIS